MLDFPYQFVELIRCEFSRVLASSRSGVLNYEEGRVFPHKMLVSTETKVRERQQKPDILFVL